MNCINRSSKIFTFDKKDCIVNVMNWAIFIVIIIVLSSKKLIKLVI